MFFHHLSRWLKSLFQSHCRVYCPHVMSGLHSCSSRCDSCWDISSHLSYWIQQPFSVFPAACYPKIACLGSWTADIWKFPKRKPPSPCPFAFSDWVWSIEIGSAICVLLFNTIQPLRVLFVSNFTEKSERKSKELQFVIHHNYLNKVHNSSATYFLRIAVIIQHLSLRNRMACGSPNRRMNKTLSKGCQPPNGIWGAPGITV